jgi:hypothetical protein
MNGSVTEDVVMNIRLFSSGYRINYLDKYVSHGLTCTTRKILSDSDKFIETNLRFKSVSGFFLASTGLANFLFFVTPRGLQE